jgi:endonuclease/exonuclease/phosphatase family metal-dependent hydrolase
MLIRPLVAAVVLASAILVSPVLSAPASAATLDIPVAEWNMCGASCYGGSATPADIVDFIIASTDPKPWLVSLTEVCFNSNQLQRMRAFLDDFGYHDNTYAARQPGVAGCGGAAFGNVVFALGNRVSASTYQFPSQDGTSEKRGVVCNINTGFLGNWQACSTHLDSDSGVQFQQVNELFNVMSLGGSMLSIVGGDFNMTPGASQLNQWRSAYDEIDEVSPFASTTDAHGKLDYIWARDVGNMSSPYAPVVDPIDAPADHHFYSGRFRISF